MGKNTKIDWTDSTFNPISGCRHGCLYCYANRIASRFSGFDETEENRRKFTITGYKGQNIYTVLSPMMRTAKDGETKQTSPYPFGFAPTLHKYNLNVPSTWKEPKDVFVCSMADLFGDFIPDEWIRDVFKACTDAPQHRYFFLTKNPMRYAKLFEKGLVPKNHDNFWFGTTVTTGNDKFFYDTHENCFLSVEPIQEEFELVPLSFKWVIIGAETGNRVGKVKPKKAWIQRIAGTCKEMGIPLFMKDSLQTLMKDEFVQEKP